VGEHGRPVRPGRHLLELAAEPAAVEDVVAEDETRWSAVEEVAPDAEGLGQAPRLGLGGEGEPQPPLAPVPEQPLEGRAIVGVVMIRISDSPASIRVEIG
jgi:hypothetical protein